MARTQLRGGDQILNNTVLREDLVLDFLGASNWDITNGAANATITGLADGVNPTDAATKGQLDSAINGIVGMVYKGTLDVATPAPDLDAIDNKAGDMYYISVGGTYLGETWTVGDMLIVRNDVAAGTTITAADVDKIDNTESTDILRTTDVIDNLTSTDTDKPLSANQGFVLKGLIDTLEGRVNDRTYSEDLVPTHNSPTLPALANTPIAGTLRVYQNGMRLREGAANDYTISGLVITATYNFKTNDVILADYER